MKSIVKKILNSKEPGQALLIVIVISTLTLMILLGVADRLLVSRTNIRQSGEFDRAITASENAANDIIKILSASSVECLTTFPKEYTQLTTSNCPALALLGADQDAAIFARESKDNFVNVSIETPLTLFLTRGDNQQVRTNGVVVKCEESTNQTTFVVSRIYVENGIYKNDKAISNCAQVNSNTNNVSNITFTDLTGADVTQATRNDTKLIRIRLLDGSKPNDISLAVTDLDGNVYSTGSYEFVIAGLGGLGSDNLIKFEKPRGDYGVMPGVFDFVYFGDDK